MTARDLYDDRVRRLPAIEQLRLAMVILEELAGRDDAASQTEQALLQQVQSSTPSNADLLRLAATHQPPQSWWDGDDDPFSAEKPQ